MAGQQYLPYSTIESFGIQILLAGGMSQEDSVVVSRHLALASLRGVDSHGLARYAMYARRVRDGGMVSPTTIDIVQDGGQVMLIDGKNGVGQVIGEKAMGLVLERSNQQGIALASVRASNHLGALSPYTLMAAKQGCIGIAMTNASPRMAPTGGAQALLGNNPWSIAVPSSSSPVVMDMANSVAALGKVRLIKARGELLPEGWARDNDGQPTRDPEAAISGLLEPIAGYKGYILALMIELLTAALSSGSPSTDVGVLTDTARSGQTSHMFLAIRVDKVMPIAEFTNNVSSITDSLRNSRRATGVNEILVPGDIEDRISKQREKEGIPLTEELLSALRSGAQEFEVPLPSWLAS